MWRPGHSSRRAPRGMRFLPFPGRGVLAAPGFIYAKVRERLLRAQARGPQGLSGCARLVRVPRTLDGCLQSWSPGSPPASNTLRTAIPLDPRGSLLHPLGREGAREGGGGPSEETVQRPSPFHCMGFLSTEWTATFPPEERNHIPNIRRKEEGWLLLGPFYISGYPQPGLSLSK